MTRTSPSYPQRGVYPHLRERSQLLSAELLARQDVVAVVSDHSTYDWSWVVEHTSLVIDTRNATKNVHRRRERVVKS